MNSCRRNIQPLIRSDRKVGLAQGAQGKQRYTSNHIFIKRDKQKNATHLWPLRRNATRRGFWPCSSHVNSPPQGSRRKIARAAATLVNSFACKFTIRMGTAHWLAVAGKVSCWMRTTESPRVNSVVVVVLAAHRRQRKIATGQRNARIVAWKMFFCIRNNRQFGRIESRFYFTADCDCPWFSQTCELLCVNFATRILHTNHSRRNQGTWSALRRPTRIYFERFFDKLKTEENQRKRRGKKAKQNMHTSLSHWSQTIPGWRFNSDVGLARGWRNLSISSRPWNIESIRVFRSCSSNRPWRADIIRLAGFGLDFPSIFSGFVASLSLRPCRREIMRFVARPWPGDNMRSKGLSFVFEFELDEDIIDEMCFRFAKKKKKICAGFDRYYWIHFIFTKTCFPFSCLSDELSSHVGHKRKSSHWRHLKWNPEIFFVFDKFRIMQKRDKIRKKEGKEMLIRLK